MMMNRRAWLLAGAAAPGWLQATQMGGAVRLPALAKLYTGFPAGGSVDAVSRRLADAMQGTYASALVVENRSGAGGRLAIEALRQAPADGLTALVSPADMFTIYPHIYPKLSYGWQDFAPVCTVSSFDYLWAVGPAVPESVRTLTDYVAWVRQDQKRQIYASPAPGTPSHFIGAVFSEATGVPLTHVGYRGSAPAIQDLLGGQIPAFCTTVPDLLAYAGDRRVRVLATATGQRSSFMPQVPTFAEQGFAQLVLSPNFLVVMLPRGTGASAVAALSDAVRDAMTLPRVQNALRALGQTPDWSDGASAQKRLQADLAHWSGIVRKTGFVAE